MKDILVRAFGVSQTQLFASDWVTSKHYSIQAKMPDGSSTSDVPEMLKSLLSTRFGPKYHTELRTIPAAILTLRKGGLKARPATPEDKRGLRPLADGAAAVHLVLPGTMADLVENIGTLANVPLIDNTGSDGRRYLFEFDSYPFGRDGGPKGNPADPLFSVEMFDDSLSPMGLHLELKKTPLETIIIDRLETSPTEN